MVPIELQTHMTNEFLDILQISSEEEWGVGGG